jgi:hypothetical protein
MPCEVDGRRSREALVHVLARIIEDQKEALRIYLIGQP